MSIHDDVGPFGKILSVSIFWRGLWKFHHKTKGDYPAADYHACQCYGFRDRPVSGRVAASMHMAYAASGYWVLPQRQRARLEPPLTTRWRTLFQRGLIALPLLLLLCFFGFAASVRPLLLRPVMRVRLFVVIPALATEEEQNLLSVFGHDYGSLIGRGWIPTVTQNDSVTWAALRP